MEDKNKLLSNYTQRLENLQQTLIENNDLENIFGDGKSLVDNELIPITHNFSDQLYMRQMNMPADTFVISAIHHTDHFWFLMTGRILVTTNGETVEHIAPCYEISIKGAKRLIKCVEDCVFINVHKNPTNTKNLDELEAEIVSINYKEYEKYINKNK